MEDFVVDYGVDLEGCETGVAGCEKQEDEGSWNEVSWDVAGEFRDGNTNPRRVI